MSFVFELKPARDERLLEQLTAALDKCAELSSRSRLPQLWKLIDRINAAPKLSGEALHKRRIWNRVFNGILVAAGLFLLIPSLMAPRELTGPLIVSVLAVVWGVFSLLRRQGTPEQSGKRPSKRFEKDARELLKGLSEPQRAGVHMRFTEKEIVVEGRQDGRQTLSYDAFLCAAETRELLLLRGRESGFVLQKRELTWAAWPDFRAFLMARGVPVAPAE